MESSDIDPLIGTMLKGAYRIDGRLGEGGMGLVYLGNQIALERPVAVKLVHPRLGDVGDIRERFLREAKLLSQLSHPHVVTVYDFGTTEKGQLFMVLELLVGETLKASVPSGGLPLARAVELMQGICSGVSAAHALHMVHRDLKPANIFVVREPDGSEVVKVLDFGQSKIIGNTGIELTQTGVPVGTPGYISPEQIRGQPDVDLRADIYALGGILQYVLTGEKPYHGTSVQEVLAMQLTAPPAPIDFEARKLPRSLEAVLKRALSHDAKDRQPTVAEFMRELRAAAKDPARDEANERTMSGGDTRGGGVPQAHPTLPYSSGGAAAVVTPPSVAGATGQTPSMAPAAVPPSGHTGGRWVLVAVALVVLAVTLAPSPKRKHRRGYAAGSPSPAASPSVAPSAVVSAPASVRPSVVAPSVSPSPRPSASASPGMASLLEHATHLANSSEITHVTEAVDAVALGVAHLAPPLFEEHFDAPNPAWEGAGEADLQVKHHHLSLRVGETYNQALYRGRMFEDGTVSAHAEFAEGTDLSGGAGILFWATNEDHEWLFCVYPNGDAALLRYVGDDIQYPVAAQRCAAISFGQRAFDLAVRLQGREIVGLVNGREALRCEGDPPAGGGMIGFLVFGVEKAHATWEFSRLTFAR